MKTVIFDLDRTITRFGTYTPFLLWYCLRNNPLRLLFAPIIILCMICYKLKIVSRKQLKIIMFALLVGTPERDKFKQACVKYAKKLIAENSYDDALKAIDGHKKDQAKLVLATASYDWLAEEIGEQLGFDNVVATKSIKTDNQIKPGVLGENCYGQNKLDMVFNALGPFSSENSAHEVWFYTDHHTDIVLLDKCTHPVVVNGTKRLLIWAEKKSSAQSVQWR